MGVGSATPKTRLADCERGRRGTAGVMDDRRCVPAGVGARTCRQPRWGRKAGCAVQVPAVGCAVLCCADSNAPSRQQREGPDLHEETGALW